MGLSTPGYIGTPSIIYLENDQSATIGLVTNLRFAGFGEFSDGPVLDVTAISSRDEQVATFGPPTATNFNEWWNIGRVFDYKSNNLGGQGRIVRVLGTGSLNGALGVTSSAIVNETDTTTQLFKNDTDTESPTIVYDTHSVANSGDDTVTRVKFFNKYATSNVVKIAVSNVTDFGTALIKTGVTFTADFTAQNIPAITGTQIAIAVLDSADTVVERYVVDLTDGNLDDLGQSNYIDDVINSRSTRILAYANTALTTDVASFETTALVKGNLVSPTKADFITGLALFNDYLIEDIKYMVGHKEIVTEQFTLAEARDDVFLFFGVDLSDVVGIDGATASTNVIDYATTLATSTTFASYIANAALIFDNYRNKRVFVGLAGDALGLRIVADIENRFLASSGLVRGILRNVIKLAFNPSVTQQINIHRANGISVINYPTVGNVLWEVNTFSTPNSVLRQNVSRATLIDIVKAIRSNLVFNLFDNNDVITRASIKAKIDSFLDVFVAGGGVVEYRSVVDETNNTPAIIDSGILIIDVALKLPRVIKMIVFRATLTDSGTDLETLF